MTAAADLRREMDAILDARQHVLDAANAADEQVPARLVVQGTGGRLLVGSCFDALDVGTLNRHQVTHVLNAASTPFFVRRRRASCELKERTESLLQSDLCPLLVAYKEIGARDVAEYPILANHLDGACAFVVDAWASSERGSVLLHCQFGVNRSAALAIGLLVRVYGWSLSLATQRVADARDVAILTNHSYRDQLASFAASPLV